MKYCKFLVKHEKMSGAKILVKTVFLLCVIMLFLACNKQEVDLNLDQNLPQDIPADVDEGTFVSAKSALNVAEAFFSKL